MKSLLSNKQENLRVVIETLDPPIRGLEVSFGGSPIGEEKQTSVRNLILSSPNLQEIIRHSQPLIKQGVIVIVSIEDTKFTLRKETS